MDRALIIYDLTGKVWSIVYGAEEAPQGMPSLWCDIPAGASVDHVDVATGQVVFEYLPDTDLGQFQQQIRMLQASVDNFTVGLSDINQSIEDASGAATAAADSAQNAMNQATQVGSELAITNDDITNLQIGLAEVFEMLLGEGA